VLERGEVANSWRRERWNSLRLLTPNWLSRLPGLSYEGPDPDGYMTMGEVTEFVERFAKVSGAPVRTGTNVTSVDRIDDGYQVTANGGQLACRAVVIASGACNRPAVPGLSAAVPAQVEQLTTFGYRDPAGLPGGGVLVVGASATGVQLAAELRRSGRQVTLAVGEHVRMPRMYRGKDVLWWMDASGVWDERYDEVDDLIRARGLPSPQLVGSPERVTLDLSALTGMGIELVGRLAAIRDGRALFSGGLRNVLALADLKLGRLLDTFDEWALTGATPSSTRRSASRRRRPPPRRGCSLTCKAARSLRSYGRRVSGLTTGGSACPWSTRRVICATRVASSTARDCTRWGCPCCGGVSPRSSTASRTTRAR
jgi:putative flavoprotein involved in K+ transport